MGRHATRLASLAPLALVPLVFVAVLRSADPPAPLARASVPDEPFVPDRCTWACHNRGCRHRPVLPPVLTADEHLFGSAVRALHSWGDALAPDDPFGGYRAANLAVFCAAWPAAMFALWVGALRVRAERRALAAGRR
jgi:hypothetical protein